MMPQPGEKLLPGWNSAADLKATASILVMNVSTMRELTTVPRPTMVSRLDEFMDTIKRASFPIQTAPIIVCPFFDVLCDPDVLEPRKSKGFRSLRTRAVGGRVEFVYPDQVLKQVSVRHSDSVVGIANYIPSIVGGRSVVSPRPQTDQQALEILMQVISSSLCYLAE